MPDSAYPPPVRPPSRRPAASVNRPGDPPGRKTAPAVAVVLATTEGSRLACAEGTLVDRLADQLTTLAVTTLHTVTRAAAGAASPDRTSTAHATEFGTPPVLDPVPQTVPPSPDGLPPVLDPVPDTVPPSPDGTASGHEVEPGPRPGAGRPEALERELEGDPAAQHRDDPAAQRRDDPAAQHRDDPAAQRRSDPVTRHRSDPVTEDASGTVPSPGLTGDLRAVAAVARAGAGPVAVFPGDLVAHTEALALLLADPARGTGALVAPEHDLRSRPGAPATPFPATTATPIPPFTTTPPFPPVPSRAPVRAERGRVVAAGNSFHTVSEPNARFRGVLHVGEADLASFADVADELANLARDRRLGGTDDTEVTELLLAGLVRVGVTVRAVPLGRLHCARVTGQKDADAAIARLAEVDEDRARLAAAVKSDDGFVATFLVSSWSRHVVRAAARLGLTPNAVTGLSVGLAGLAAVAFSAGQRRAQLAGAVLLYLSFVLDCVDGQLARYTRAFSPLGAWLDATFDRVKEYVVYVGLAVGYAGGVDGGVTGPGGVWALAVAAMLVQAIRHMIDFSYAGARAEAAGVDLIWERPGHAASLDLKVPLRRDPPGAPFAATAGRTATAAGAATMTGANPVVRRRGTGGLVVRLSARLDRNTASRWLKKIIILPIGERMMLIAVTAGLFNARVTFLALLAWGGLAALYTLTGRIARSL
ncbi:CDP-alcohol phosphatidyltransferase family protein [Sphaerisporangium dianthi]|uniref:CDP-alcohol phosphatidyltransferase family protein n=1 Tax=Sphaerisporangium dianthi TaxID=1436120 RepID=A0ABV9CGX5_9ACTN